ncbi:MAG: sulfotransferase [Proteobacteria bacterium]|nr:sulfotransferase [Pseudomonadota bacterium]
MSEPTNIAIIIGAMKSGTTTLFELLSQHPEIAPCREKEPFFFASEEKYAADEDAYQMLWDWDPNRHKIALEASTDYAKLPFVTGVPDRMAACDKFRFRFMGTSKNSILSH